MVLASGVFRDLLVGLSEHVWPVREAAGHQAGVDEIEWLVVQPQVFGVVHDKFKVRWHAVPVRLNFIADVTEYTYRVGCPGLRSTPVTWQSVCKSAKSIAQIPVPVPMSRHLFGSCKGEKYSRLP